MDAHRHDGRSFVCLPRVARPRLRLFFLPHAGGGPGAFRHWDLPGPADVEYFAAQHPGREARFREPVPRRLDPLFGDLLRNPSVGLPFYPVRLQSRCSACARFRPPGPGAHWRGAGHIGAKWLRRAAMQVPHCTPACIAHPLWSRYGNFNAGRDAGVRIEKSRVTGSFGPVLRADLELLETRAREYSEPLTCPCWP
jgi:hypothetical protein